MKLVFIRHGDPDYANDTLTEKGWREAEILSDRVGKMNIKDIYCSPLGRAKDTASLSLKKLGRTAQECEWLKEFFVPVIDPESGKERIPWDFMPSYWTKEEIFYDKDSWTGAAVMQTGKVKEEYQKVVSGIEEILTSHGYVREGRAYRVENANTDTLVFFCHLGVQFVILSHLLGISAPVLWQNFFVAPTSVTVLETEEREKGIAAFRCKTVGDTSHLYAAGEMPSRSGFFEEIKE